MCFIANSVLDNKEFGCPEIARYESQRGYTTTGLRRALAWPQASSRVAPRDGPPVRVRGRRLSGDVRRIESAHTPL